MKSSSLARPFWTALDEPDIKTDQDIGPSASPVAPPETRTSNTFAIDPRLLSAPTAKSKARSQRQVDPYTTPQRVASLYSSERTPKRQVADSKTSAHKSRSAKVQVTIRASHGTQRIWYIGKSLLIRHSAKFRTECEDPSTISITICHDTFSDFQDFVDFVHSSIYSVNKRVPDYHPIGANLQAWFIGTKFEAHKYQTAALRELYTWIEPLARACSTTIAYTPIRTEDLEFVCLNLSDEDIVRTMIIDAFAAHCTQNDAIAVSATLLMPNKDTMREGAPSSSELPEFSPTPHVYWGEMAVKHKDFGRRIVDSQKVADRSRSDFLRPIEEYLAGCTVAVDKGSGKQKRAELVTPSLRPASRGGRSGGASTEFGGSYMRSPGQRRSSSVRDADGSEGSRSPSIDAETSEDEYMKEDGEKFGYI